MTATTDLKPYHDAIHREVIAPALAALKKRLLDDRAGASERKC